MPLSIQKLDDLFLTKGFIPKRYFKLHNLCVFIEVISSKSADTFMISLPSKYKFDLSGNVDLRSDADIFRLKAVSTEERDDITDEYAGSPDNIDLEKKYAEVEMDTTLPFKNRGLKQVSMAERLIETYKRPISLKDLEKQDTLDVKDIFRQLKRLRYCVQSIRYKLIIIFKSYLCVLNLDDSIECFYIRNFSQSQNNRNLLVTCDLELMYEKIDSIEDDIRHVMNGIYKVLDKNQLAHSKNLQLLLEKRSDAAVSSEFIYRKKEGMKTYMTSFENLLSSTVGSEKKVLEKLAQLRERREQEASTKGLYSDIEYSHEKKRIEDELAKIRRVKGEIMENIIKVKERLENICLTVDKILFDNIVMLDTIFENFDQLGELAK